MPLTLRRLMMETLILASSLLNLSNSCKRTTVVGEMSMPNFFRISSYLKFAGSFSNKSLKTKKSQEGR